MASRDFLLVRGEREPLAKYAGQYEFESVLGPARVAYLIKPNSEAGFRRAATEACTRWGGETEPIIPVRANGRIDAFWRQIVELSNVDALVNVDLPTAVASIAAESLGLGCVDIAHIDEWGIGRFSCNPSVVADREPLSPWVYADCSLDLWAVTAAGSFTPEAAAHNMANNQPLISTSFPDQVARSQISGTTALERTLAQFGERWARNVAFASPAIVWICARRQFGDCLMFWNCRALRPIRFGPLPMILVPEYEVDHWLGFGPQVTSLFAGRPDDFAPDALFTGLRVPFDRLREIAQSWGLVESDEDFRSGHEIPPPPMRTPPFTFKVGYDVRGPVIFERKYGATSRFPVQVFAAGTDVRFGPPVEFHAGGYLKIGFASEYLDRYPKRPEIARLIQNESRWRDGTLEIMSGTLPEYRFSLRFPALDDVVTTILRQTTTVSKLSDKGRTGESIASREGLADLLVPGMYETIRSLTTRRAKHLYDELRALTEADGNVDLAAFVADVGGRIERRSLSAGQIEGVTASRRAEALERMVALGWAERGLRIKCLQCDITSFVLLGDATPDAVCPGCRREQSYERSNSGPTVFYRLNALIDRASDQGVIPHLVAIAALRREDPECVISPGIDVEFGDGYAPEIDLYGILKGSVLAGEVKTSPDDFTQVQLTRDLDIARRLGVDVHVMAWFGKLSDATRERAQHLARQARVELRLLDLDALRR